MALASAVAADSYGNKQSYVGGKTAAAYGNNNNYNVKHQPSPSYAGATGGYGKSIYDAGKYHTAINTYGHQQPSHPVMHYQAPAVHAVGNTYGHPTSVSHGVAAVSNYGQSSYGHGGYRTDYVVSLYTHHLYP